MSSESEYYSETSSSDELQSDDEQNINLELTGDILKNYNIIYKLGKGSFSTVWLAFNITDNKFYALKVQNSSEYKAGVEEINFVKKLPTNPPVFNNII